MPLQVGKDFVGEPKPTLCELLATLGELVRERVRVKLTRACVLAPITGDVANGGQVATNGTAVTPVVPTNSSLIVAGANDTVLTELPWQASQDPAYDFVSR